MIDDSNPYEETEAQTQPPVKFATPNWLAILVAGGIYYGARFLCSLVFRIYYDSTYDDRSKFAYYVLMVIPWAAGAIYLACVVRHKWAMHGLIYSFIPLLVLAISVIFKPPGTYSPLLIDVIFWQFSTIIVTLLTMALTRSILKATRGQ